MFISATSLSAILSLFAISAFAAPAADIKKATPSKDYGQLPHGWASASDSLILDNQNYQRALTGQFEGGFSVVKSPAECIQFCDMAGWPLAGVEYGGECFCGSELKNDGSLKVLNYREAMKCPKPYEHLNCGAPDGLNLFYNPHVLKKKEHDFELKHNPTKQTNGFKKVDKCFQETGDGAARLFKGAFFASDDMTSTKCTDFCKSKNFKQAGLEYGRECRCSNDVDLWKAASSDQCTLTCKGRRTEICGGHDALTVYESEKAQGNELSGPGGKLASSQEDTEETAETDSALVETTFRS